MTTEVIILSCGHGREVTLSGKAENRTRKREWYRAHGVCNACYKAERSEQIQVLECKLGLPELTGSNSQVSYARGIRAKKIEQFLSEYEGEVTVETIAAAIAERTKGSRVFFEDSARFWLDNKGKRLNTLIKATKMSRRRPKLELEQKQHPVHFAKRKTVLYDLETDGCDPKRDPIIQIAAVALDVGLNVIDEFEVKIKFRPATDGAALGGLNSYDEEAWNNDAVTDREAAHRFCEFVKRHATIEMQSKRGKPYRVAELAGHNIISFDEKFLRRFYKERGEFFPGSYEVIDTLVVARNFFRGRPHRPKNMKLETLAEFFGVELNNAHDALADVRANAAVWREMERTPAATNDVNVTQRGSFGRSKRCTRGGGSKWGVS